MTHCMNRDVSASSDQKSASSFAKVKINANDSPNTTVKNVTRLVQKLGRKLRYCGARTELVVKFLISLEGDSRCMASTGGCGLY